MDANATMITDTMASDINRSIATCNNREEEELENNVTMVTYTMASNINTSIATFINREEEEELENKGMLDDKVGKTKMSLKQRLLNDKETRRKFILWICLCFSSGIMGWVIGQLGPSLLDLKEITGSELEEASFFLTSTFLGYLIGTLFTGFVYERVNPYLILFTGLLGLALTSAAIPWCSLYGIMIFMHILKGMGFGLLDTAANSVFMANFKNDKNIQSYMHTIHLMFAVGGFFSPIATAPFLMTHYTNVFRNEENCTDHQCIITHQQKIPNIYENNTGRISKFVETIGYMIHNSSIQETQHDSITNVSHLKNSSFRNETDDIVSQNSMLYRAYFITASLCVFLSVPFLIMCIHQTGPSRKTNLDVNKQKRSIPLHFKICILTLMCLFLGIDNGMEDVYFGLFSSFVVEQLNWTKRNASYVMSVYWGSFAFGRLSAIFVGQKLKCSKLLLYYIHIFLFAMVGLLVSTIFEFHIGVWIFLPTKGFAVSVFFPTIFIWTEADFFTVAGKVSSVLMLAASLGSMLNPIIIGYLMSTYGATSFLYVTLGDGVALYVIVGLTIIASKRVRKYHRNPDNEKENT